MSAPPSRRSASVAPPLDGPVPSRAARLGAFVRAHREQVAPGDVGLPAGLRRRAPGLRREELAGLCGISPTWLTWIEQGRPRSISAATLAALARGLRLDAAARAYLFDLAGQRDPQPPARAAAAPPAELAQLVRLVRSPAYALDGLWDAVAWNAPAARLFPGWLRRGAPEANLLRYTFVRPDARALIADWPERARRLVAEFRADVSARLDEPAVVALVQGLRRDSTDFDRWWRGHDVREREGGERVFLHPVQGRVAYRQLTLRPAQDDATKVIVLAPLQALNAPAARRPAPRPTAAAAHGPAAAASPPRPSRR